MGFKEFIKPTKGKIIFAIIITIIWYLLALFFSHGLRCAMCPPLDKFPCEGGMGQLQIIYNCNCCFTFSDFIAQIINVFLFPFVLAYLIYPPLLRLKNKIFSH